MPSGFLLPQDPGSIPSSPAAPPIVLLLVLFLPLHNPLINALPLTPAEAALSLFFLLSDLSFSHTNDALLPLLLAPGPLALLLLKLLALGTMIDLFC